MGGRPLRPVAMRRLLAAWALFAALCAVQPPGATAAASVRRDKSACPGGCIIATTTYPTRTCACVRERCNPSRAAAGAAAGVASSIARAAAAEAAQAQQQASISGGGSGAGPATVAMAAMSSAAVASPFAAAALGGIPPTTSGLRKTARARANAAQATDGGDCGFCAAAYNTYSSIAECEADGQAMIAAVRAEPGIARGAVYAPLSEPQAAAAAQQMVAMFAPNTPAAAVALAAAAQASAAAVAAPNGTQAAGDGENASTVAVPAAAAAALTLSGGLVGSSASNGTAEGNGTLGSNGTADGNATAVGQFSAAQLKPRADACPWPITPPTGDGVSRTSCPYDATADASLVRWESLFPAATAASDVTLPAGARVVISGCALAGGALSVASITVPSGSALIIADQPLALSFRLLTVNGALLIGSPACSIASAITVTVPGGNATYGIDVAKPGSLDIHGTVPGLTWTRVAATVPASAPAAPSRAISLAEPVRWAAGDKIVLVSTFWKDLEVNQNEVLTVASVSGDGRTVTVSEAIQFPHYGGEYAAEVGLLSRRILFTSDAASTATGLGPHTTLFGPNARVAGAAWERWGARNVAGRYSLHFHLAGAAPGAYVKNNAFYTTNWRCMTIHGTHDVYVYGNVCFNVHGHGYYLEDGVEERNVLERNLAAYVKPIQVAGSGGGQQGTDRWQSADLFDPTDAGAAGFYSLNAYNTWINNAASGGFAGFSFPNAPRAIKDHRGYKDPQAPAYPFSPSRRPFIRFQGNTAHSSGYHWEHGACFYVGGFLLYRVNPADGKEVLFYNNGRGTIHADALCPDPAWPKDANGNYLDGAKADCDVGSRRATASPNGTADGFLKFEDLTAALCNVGVTSWGQRAEVNGLRAYDVTRGAEFLGQAWVTGALFQVNTQNSLNGWSQWPFPKYPNGWKTGGTPWWNTPPIKGFEFYDTFTSTLLSNVTFRGYKYFDYPVQPGNWWTNQTPSVFRMLSHSDLFKPDKTMMASKGVRVEGYDPGTCTAGGCAGQSLFRVDRTNTGSAWQFNWEDADGSLVRTVDPSRPAQPYIIGSYVSWWNLHSGCWLEPKLSGVWVCPKTNSNLAIARLDIRVLSVTGKDTLTVPYEWGYEDRAAIGFNTLYGSMGKKLVLTKTEGTVGPTGDTGWYTVFQPKAPATHAARRLRITVAQLPRRKWVYWTSCFPAGTTFAISRAYAWSACMNTAALPQVASRSALAASGDGNAYFVDAKGCLTLKLTDPGRPWIYTDSFQRDGMYIEEEVGWFDQTIDIVATGPTAGCDAYWCPLPGDPAARLPAAATALSPTCSDAQPPDAPCPAVQCGWKYWPGCANPTIVTNGYCRLTCGGCQTTVYTALSVKTLSAACPTGTVSLTLKNATATIKAVRLCATTAAVPDGSTQQAFVTDVVAVAKAAAGAVPPAVSAVSCPAGYTKVATNLNEGAAAVGGVSTTVVLCYKTGTAIATDNPLLRFGTAGVSWGCGSWDGLRAAAFGAGSLKAGAAANLAEGTAGPALYLCLRPRKL